MKFEKPELDIIRLDMTAIFTSNEPQKEQAELEEYILTTSSPKEE